MGELKDQMLRLMELKNFSQRTISCYMMYMKEYVGYHKKSPDKMGEEEILKYLCYLKDEKKTSWSGVNIAYSALKLFYESVLGRRWDVKRIPRPKLDKMLPAVLSRQEVKRIIEATENRKHRIALMTTYSAGLRISETSHLRVRDIDSELMQIHIVRGKGNKDRYSILSKKLLEELRKYYRSEKPKEWLFPGRDKNEPINQSTLQKAFKESKKKRRLTRQLQYIPCGIALQHTCWILERIYLQSKSFLAIPA
jgi:site-specific recombinase XerD